MAKQQKMGSKTGEAGGVPGLKLRHTLRGHSNTINRFAWSSDGRMLATPSDGWMIRLWDTATGELIRALEGYTNPVYSVTWSPDSRMLASGDFFGNITIWNVETGMPLQTLKQHIDKINSLDWSPDGLTLASGSDDKTIRLWSVTTNELLQRLAGHSDYVWSVAWSPDSGALASASWDGSIRLWNPKTTDSLWIAKDAHEGNWVNCMTWSQDERYLASGGSDRTVRIWDPHSGRHLQTLQGHTDTVLGVSFSMDSRLLASVSADDTIRFWDSHTWEQIASLDTTLPYNDTWATVTFHPREPLLATPDERQRVVHIWELDVDELFRAARPTPTVHYVNAKAVLVGDTGVGKSGLGIRIAKDTFEVTDSTFGAQFWQLSVPESLAQVAETPNLRAELTLWDFAGQPEYHIVHQLFLDDTDAALLLFDCSDAADPFRGVPYWAKVLKKQASSHAVKYLIAARCDVSPVTVDQREIVRVLAEHGLHAYLRTSAKTGEGVNDLMQRLLRDMPWEQLPRTSSPRLFQVIREYLLERKQAGDTLMMMKQIVAKVRRRDTDEQATYEQIDTVIRLLQSQGLVMRLEQSPQLVWVLMRPELLNQYAAAVLQAARNDPRDVGSIAERAVVTADFPLDGVRERLDAYREKIVLEATVELLIRHALAFRQMGLLVFPSQIKVRRPAHAVHPPTAVTYEFSGAVETIHASLVVQLSYTDHFQRKERWHYAAEFSRGGHRLGFSMQPVSEGTGALEIYFHEGVSDFDRVTFIRFITEHLHARGIDIQERIRLYCPQCKREVTDRDAIEARVRSGALDIPCQYCGAAVLIPRSIEERYQRDPAYRETQQELAATVERRTEREVGEFKRDQREYTQADEKLVNILHLSDIHLLQDKDDPLKVRSQAQTYRTHLETDLKRELKIHRLDYLIVSGDVADHATKEEYDAAFDLIDNVAKRFGLDPSRIVVVPGNHDVNWDLSEAAYPFVPKRKLPDKLPEGRYIPAGETGALIRDDAAYRRRFEPFNEHFYRKVLNVPYPLDYNYQAILHPCPKDRILFLALNSCWELDHYFTMRAGIRREAVANALNQIGGGEYDGWLKIAVWHHPLNGKEAIDRGFLELLTVHGFQIGVHGHIHEAINERFKYDDERGMTIIGAGTFGAPAKQQVAGIPLQYNVLRLDPEQRTLTVESRKKEKPDGAWSADARWGDKNNPVPRYVIRLR